MSLIGEIKVNNQLKKIISKLIKENLIYYSEQDGEYKLSSDLLLKSIPQSLGFENIAIVQKKNVCKSRLDAQIKSEFVRGITIDVPLVAANMSTVINADFYINLYNLGAIAILHRAQSLRDLIVEVRKVKAKCDIIAASIGVGKNSFYEAKELIRNDCNVLCIDVAHGYSDETLSLAKKIKKYSSDCKIIIGNSTNENILLESYDFVDAIKVGIAQGFACETKNTAGCTEKQFSAVLKFKELSKKFGVPIISDGGIREPADFVKAIAAGASTVMAGKIFAECKESAADVVMCNDECKKLYAGMASSYVQNQWRDGLKEGTCAEGGVRYLDIVGSVSDLIKRYSGALRSGITYSGTYDIDSFHKDVEFVKI